MKWHVLAMLPRQAFDVLMELRCVAEERVKRRPGAMRRCCRGQGAAVPPEGSQERAQETGGEEDGEKKEMRVQENATQKAGMGKIAGRRRLKAKGREEEHPKSQKEAAETLITT